MVDSATLARLIAHANEAEAKLVLIGDPEQLGEIEAGVCSERSPSAATRSTWTR